MLKIISLVIAGLILLNNPAYSRDFLVRHHLRIPLSDGQRLEKFSKERDSEKTASELLKDKGSSLFKSIEEPIEYEALEDFIARLKEDERKALLTYIDNFGSKQGLHSLGIQARHVFLRLLSLANKSQIEKLSCLEQDTKSFLNNLRKSDQYSYAYIAIEVLAQIIKQGDFKEIKSEPTFTGQPCVVFVVAPIPHTQINVVPIGINLVASFLQKLGVETHILDLSLGIKDGLDELRSILDSQGERLKIISFGSSNLVGPKDFDVIYKVSEIVNQAKTENSDTKDIEPRLIGGGMAFSYLGEEFMDNTPIDAIVSRFGSAAMAQMLFESDMGKWPHASTHDLFKHVHNLSIKKVNGNDIDAHTTKRTGFKHSLLLVEGRAFNLANIRYNKYAKVGRRVDICATDVLNAPIRSRKFLPSRSGVFPLNVLGGHKEGRQMTVIQSAMGNCTRGCAGCIYTQWNRGLVPYPAGWLRQDLREIIKKFPETDMVGFIDDDFLLKRKETLRQILDCFADSSITRRLPLYMETIPLTIYEHEKIFRNLRRGGIKACVLGVENPVVRRILVDLGKLRVGTHQEVFETFRMAPREAVDLGLSVRATMMLFYPIITESELFETLEEYILMIDYGIDLAIFPFLQPRHGSKAGEIEGLHEKISRTHLIKNSEGKRVSFGEKVLPDDPFVRELSSKSLARAGTELDKIVATHGLGKEYHPQLINLAFIRAVFNTWLEMNSAEVVEPSIKNALDRIEDVIARVAVKGKDGLKIKDMLYNVVKDGDIKDKSLVSFDDIDRHNAMFYLRRYIDFGSSEEKIAACKLLDHFISQNFSPKGNVVNEVVLLIKEPERQASKEAHLIENLLNSLVFQQRNTDAYVEQAALKISNALIKKMGAEKFSHYIAKVDKTAWPATILMGDSSISSTEEIQTALYLSSTRGIDDMEHSLQVCRFSEEIARNIGFREDDISCAVRAASVHEIGRSKLNWYLRGKVLEFAQNYDIRSLFMREHKEDLVKTEILNILRDNKSNSKFNTQAFIKGAKDAGINITIGSADKISVNLSAELQENYRIIQEHDKVLFDVLQEQVKEIGFELSPMFLGTLFYKEHPEDLKQLTAEEIIQQLSKVAPDLITTEQKNNPEDFIDVKKLQKLASILLAADIIESSNSKKRYDEDMLALSGDWDIISLTEGRFGTMNDLQIRKSQFEQEVFSHVIEIFKNLIEFPSFKRIIEDSRNTSLSESEIQNAAMWISDDVNWGVLQPVLSLKNGQTELDDSL